MMKIEKAQQMMGHRLAFFEQEAKYTPSAVKLQAFGAVMLGGRSHTLTRFSAASDEGRQRSSSAGIATSGQDDYRQEYCAAEADRTTKTAEAIAPEALCRCANCALLQA